MGRKYRRPIKRGPKSDPQQYRVYRMEFEAISSCGYISLTQRTLRRFARMVCRQYGVRPPRLVFKDIGRWAGEWAPPTFPGKRPILTLNPAKRGSLDLLVLAHELAHHLHWVIAADLDQEQHGPQFMACYLSILDTARLLPLVAMEAVCKMYRIRYIHPGKT